MAILLFSHAGEASGCFMNSVVINQSILSVTLCAKQFFGAVKPKQIGMVPPAGYVTQVQGFLNLKGHPNCIIGVRVGSILLNGGRLPNSGVAPAACN